MLAENDISTRENDENRDPRLALDFSRLKFDLQNMKDRPVSKLTGRGKEN